MGKQPARLNWDSRRYGKACIAHQNRLLKVKGGVFQPQCVALAERFWESLGVANQPNHEIMRLYKQSCIRNRHFSRRQGVP